MPKPLTMRAQWRDTPIGETMQEIQHLHETLDAQSAPEQEATRQHIEDLARELRAAGVRGRYDRYVGRFVEDPGGKRLRKQI